MSNEIMQETTTLVERSAFHRAMSVLEASLRNTEDSEAIINGLLKGVAEFYGASRASVLEADWELGIGVITYEWCKDGVQAQRDMLQCLPMEKFPRWRKALRANKPVMISDLQRLERVYPDEAAFFREYGVTTLLAAPFSKRINQGFIAVDDPTRYTDDPVFLFIASYAVVLELNEIKQQQSLLAATKASKYNPEDIHINFFGGMEIISSKGTLTGEDIKEGRHLDQSFPELPLALLESTPFIMLKEENNIYKRGARMCSIQNYVPNIVLKPDSVVSAFNMACSGVGATFIPDGLIKNLNYDVPLCYYKMNEELALRRLYLYKKRNKYMSRAMEEFIRLTVGDEKFEEIQNGV